MSIDFLIPYFQATYEKKFHFLKSRCLTPILFDGVAEIAVGTIMFI